MLVSARNGRVSSRTVVAEQCAALAWIKRGKEMLLEETRGYFHKTNLEERAGDILNELGIEFTPQYPTRTGFVLDFAIFTDEAKIDLEVDGRRWHSSKRARKKDNFRNYMLRREGWEIYRIREKFFDEDFDRFKMELLG